MCRKTMPVVALSLALAVLFGLGLTHALAQERDPGTAPAPQGEATVGQQEEGAPAAEGEQEATEEAEGAEATAELEPIPASFDFEAGILSPHWVAYGAETALEIVTEPGQALGGRGALQFSYMPAENALPFVTVAPLQVVGEPTVLRFALKTDGLSSIRYAVHEQDGTSYEGYCYAPPGQWIRVEAALSEMMLAQDSNDENAKLDGGQISGITVMDLCNLPGEIGRALGIKQGRQRLWLDDIELTHGAAPLRSSRQPDGTVIVDDFEGQVACFLPIGAPDVEFVPGAPAAGDRGACRIVYRLGGHRWVGLVRGVGHLDLSGLQEFCLLLNAQHRARLVAVLEEWDGSKYETNVDLDPEAGWTEVALPIAQYVLDPQTDDENRQLDLDQIRVVILVVDTFNASVNAMGEGSFTISRMSFR